MNEPKNINASLFTTALCACLGLLAVGTPLQARARLRTAERDQFVYVSTIRSGFGAAVVVSLQKLKAADHWLADSVARVEGQPDELLYQNSKPLIEHNQVLIVTRLPRAGLSDAPAKPLAARLSRDEV